MVPFPLTSGETANVPPTHRRSGLPAASPGRRDTCRSSQALAVASCVVRRLQRTVSAEMPPRPFNGFVRHGLIEVKIAVDGGSTPLSELVSGDVPACVVRGRARDVRMTPVTQPCTCRDPGHVACRDPERIDVAPCQLARRPRFSRPPRSPSGNACGGALREFRNASRDPAVSVTGVIHR